MAKHNETGKKGEDMAVNWLLEQGYIVLERNWRFQKAEIDIIASKDRILHIVEVKTSKSNRFGFPEERVNKKKIQLMMKAGAYFLAQHREWKRIQYNILSIILQFRQPASFYLIEDIHCSGL